MLKVPFPIIYSKILLTRLIAWLRYYPDRSSSFHIRWLCCVLRESVPCATSSMFRFLHVTLLCNFRTSKIILITFSFTFPHSLHHFSLFIMLELNKSISIAPFEHSVSRIALASSRSPCGCTDWKTNFFYNSIVIAPRILDCTAFTVVHKSRYLINL